MQHVAVRTALVAVVLALAAGLHPMDLRAQATDADQARWHPAWGDWSLSFFLPEGGGAGAGFWNLRSPRMALGLTVEGVLASQNQEDPILGEVTLTNVRLAFGPALKYYWWRPGPVSPFLRAGLTGVYDRAEAPGAATWRLGGGANAGIGAEWFPTEGIGIGGHAGVDFRYSLVTDDNDATGDRSGLTLTLFTSALSIQFYF